MTTNQDVPQPGLQASVLAASSDEGELRFSLGHLFRDYPETLKFKTSFWIPSGTLQAEIAAVEAKVEALLCTAGPSEAAAAHIAFQVCLEQQPVSLSDSPKEHSPCSCLDGG